MKLEIRDTSGLLKPEFGKWLCKRLHFMIMDRLDPKKCVTLNKFFNSKQNTFLHPISNDKEINTANIILEGSRNFVCYGNPLVLQVDPNKFVFGFEQAKLNTICKFINYGNQSVTGYPIFTEIFEEVASNIDDYVEEYFYTLPH